MSLLKKEILDGWMDGSEHRALYSRSLVARNSGNPLKGSEARLVHPKCIAIVSPRPAQTTTSTPYRSGAQARRPWFHENSNASQGQ